MVADAHSAVAKMVKPKSAQNLERQSGTHGPRSVRDPRHHRRRGAGQGLDLRCFRTEPKKHSGIQIVQTAVRLATVLVATLLLPYGARADGGELHLKIVINNDFDALHQPSIHYQEARPALAYVPRFGAEVGYALANWLEIGIGATASIPRDAVSEHVAAHGIQDVNVSASVFSVTIPATIRFVWHPKGSVSYAAALSAGMVLTRWVESSVTEASPAEQPAKTYATPPFETVNWSPIAGGGLFVRWRAVDWMAMEGGPYLARTLIPDDWRFGIGLHAVFVFEAGPSF